MPTSRTRALSLADYNNGANILPETDVPDWATDLTIEVARNTLSDLTVWPLPTQTLSVVIEYTLDGVTWREWMRGEDVGGPPQVHSKTGEEIAYVKFSGPIPLAPGRKARGTLTVGGGPVRTTAFITLSS